MEPKEKEFQQLVSGCSAQHADYTASQLKAFRQYSINEQTGSEGVERVNAMMNNVAMGLTNEEIDALSQYIAGLH